MSEHIIAGLAVFALIIMIGAFAYEWMIRQ
jgi:hypothetical protein